MSSKCKCIIKTGPKAGTRCTAPAKGGAYCGRHTQCTMTAVRLEAIAELVHAQNINEITTSDLFHQVKTLWGEEFVQRHKATIKQVIERLYSRKLSILNSKECKTCTDDLMELGKRQSSPAPAKRQSSPAPADLFAKLLKIYNASLDPNGDKIAAKFEAENGETIDEAMQNCLKVSVEKFDSAHFGTLNTVASEAPIAIHNLIVKFVPTYWFSLISEFIEIALDDKYMYEIFPEWERVLLPIISSFSKAELTLLFDYLVNIKLSTGSASEADNLYDTHSFNNITNRGFFLSILAKIIPELIDAYFRNVNPISIDDLIEEEEVKNNQENVKRLLKYAMLMPAE